MNFLVSFAIILTLLILLFIVSQIRYRITYRRASKRYGCAPPPRLASKDPIFGVDNVLTDMKQRRQKRKIRSWYNTFRSLGRTFEFFPFGRRVIATVDARNVHFVLVTGFKKFGVGPAREKATMPMMGRGIICADGEPWRKGRDLILPTFARSQIADRDMFEKHVQRFMERLPHDETTVDLAPLFDRLVSIRRDIGRDILTFSRFWMLPPSSSSANP